MQRHEQIIQLSDHVKNKLKQHQYLTATSSFINSSDEFVEINSTDDDNDLDSVSRMPSENVTRQRSDTYTTYGAKQSSGEFFTERKSNQYPSTSVLQEKYKKEQQCQECIHRDRIIHLQRQDLLRLYNQNKQLTNQLRSSVLINHQYEGDIQKLKYHLTKVNAHLYEYQMNLNHLKQKIVSDKKASPKVDEEEDEEEEEQQQQEDKQEVTSNHIKRLRYEIEMYNRIVAAKQKQEQKQIDYLF